MAQLFKGQAAEMDITSLNVETVSSWVCLVPSTVMS